MFPAAVSSDTRGVRLPESESATTEAITGDAFPILESVAQLFLQHIPRLSEGRDPVAHLGRLLRDLWLTPHIDDDCPEPNRQALHLAERVLGAALDLEYLPHRVRRAPDGGIILAYRRGNAYGKLEVFNDGDLYVAISGGVEPRVWPVATADSDIAAAIETIRGHVG